MAQTRQQIEKEAAAFWKSRERKSYGFHMLPKKMRLGWGKFSGLLEKLDNPFGFYESASPALNEKTIRELVRPGNGFTRTVWDHHWSGLVVKSLQYKMAGIHQFGLFRRAFRSTKHPEHYGTILFGTLRALVQLQRYNLTPDEYIKLFFERPEYLEQNYWVSQALTMMIAVKLDEGDPKTVEYCHCAIYENTRAAGRPLIEALLYSEQESSWKMLADLLIAARLQEGLRQTIMEACSDGRLDAFRYMMKVIQEHNLIRFASVVRAFDTWTGLGLEAARPAAIKNALDTAVTMLDDPAARTEALKDGNPQQLFLAFWALGNSETDDALAAVEKVLQDQAETVPRKCAAMFFMEMAQRPYTYNFIATHSEIFGDDQVAQACLLRTFPEVQVQYLLVNKQIPSEPSEQRRLYDTFLRWLDALPAKEKKIDNPFFPQCELKLSRQPVWVALVRLAVAGPDHKMLHELARRVSDMPTPAQKVFFDEAMCFFSMRKPLLPVSLFGRESYSGQHHRIRRDFPRTPELRAFLLESVNNRSLSVRLMALECIEFMPGSLSFAELEKLENLLTLKNDAVREAAIRIIKRSPHRKAFLKHLEESNKELALKEFKRKRRHKARWNLQNGFGLYTPRLRLRWELPKAARADHPRQWMKEHFAAARQLIKDLDQLVEENREFEYLQTNYDGSQRRVVLGSFGKDQKYWGLDLQSSHKNAGLETFDMFPLPEVWREFFAGRKDSPETVLTALVLMHSVYCEDNKVPFALRVFYGSGLQNTTETPPRWIYHIPLILSMRAAECVSVDVLTVYLAAIARHTPWYFSFLLTKQSGYDWAWDDAGVVFWFNLLARMPFSPDAFKLRAYWFSRRYFTVLRERMLPAYLDAHEAGFIDEKEVYRFIFEDNDSRGYNRIFQRDEFRKHPLLLRCIERLVDTELTERLELPIDASSYASNLNYVPGTSYFVRILTALGKEPLVRGYTYGTGKYNVLSHLLKMVRPLPGENAETLRSLLKENPVPEQRLIEAAMYNPAWLGIVGEYLNVPDLPAAGWYFHAHISESFNEEKETAIARWTKVTPQEFNDGAFDIEWFNFAHKAVGEEMFKRLYDAAKYIAGAAYHRRSQIFSDAALGKLKLEEIEANMDSKRNKEMVMAYGIVPGKDFRRRYEKLQKFAKESKQFGAQRQASEKLAVETAIANLSRTAGFDDVTRFLWTMEDEKLKELAPLFKPQKAGQVILNLLIDETGKPSINVEKNGKVLKAVPAALKGNACVNELQSAVRELREQHRRARRTLESAMERGDVFQAAEARSIAKNPVLGPLANALLWNHGEEIFFLDEMPKGIKTLTIAHPLDLLNSGRWVEFQQLLIGKKLIQPFKQVFRELYVQNEDEKLDGFISMRYAGHQIQPRKAAALLRTRGWMPVPYTGLQKVFHRENLIARVSAEVDWLTPSEVEPPALGGVMFLNRRTEKAVPFAEIPPRLFSETMRDVDLVVSVAHAGGVDPEASHSTVEMRTALIGAMLPLFKLGNVRLEGNHAFVKGKYGEYTVHLGSGVCHKAAQGMIHILAVHSAQRGRIFLPFADDDPKTAEIITKILFLAEDSKIKDPNILNQLQ